MTSEERRESRYQKRKAERDSKASALCGKSFDEVFSFRNLYKAGKRCCNSTRWKTSTISFETFLLRKTLESYRKVHTSSRKFAGFQSFTTIEHGKERDIDALPIEERAIQKCLCQNLVTELFSRSFVYDNSASLKNKGMDFTLKRLTKHLSDHYHKYGTEGGIYQFDFKSYFASLPHHIIKERIRKKIKDDRIFELATSFVDDFQRMRKADHTGEPHGVGLGSEISQIIALEYVNTIDHYIKDVRKIKGYGRYMDDGYVISNSLEELQDIKKEVYALAAKLGIKMSDKKNIITPFQHHSFTFLKMRIRLNENGKVTMKLSKRTIKAARRKLKTFRKWLDEGSHDAEDIFSSYQSWRAHAKRCDSYRTLRNMDEAFVALFKEELRVRKKKFPCTLKAIKTLKGWKYVRHPDKIKKT